MFDCIVISGGATKGHCSTGILSKHENEIQNVSTYVGCSVGAVLCTLLSMGATCDEIRRIGLETRCETPVGIGWLSSIGSFFTNLGLISRNTYLDVVTGYILSRYGKIPTLLELFNMNGKNLQIIASAVVARQRIVLSYRTHPHISIIDALHMSIRMPVIFTPIYFEGDLVVDGGRICHFPIDLRVGRTLAIHTYNKARDIQSMIREPSIIEYIGLLLACSSPINIPRDINGILYDIAYDKKGMMQDEDESTYMFRLGRDSIPLISN